MKFSVNQQDLQKSLNYCQGVIEKRSTLPILSNVLLEVSNANLTITATDLDLIFIHKIPNVEISEEGKTTSSSSIMYDIVRKFSSGSKINFSNPSENKLHLESDKSVFKGILLIIEHPGNGKAFPLWSNLFSAPFKVYPSSSPAKNFSSLLTMFKSIRIN